MVERHKVLLFLELMKRTARVRFTIVGRRKTLDSLARLGITRRHAESLVMGLRPEDYVDGPMADRQYPDLEMWVFGLRVSGQEVYVKLQVFVNPAHCVCVSFHIAEQPMHYPLHEAQSPESGEGQ